MGRFVKNIYNNEQHQNFYARNYDVSFARCSMLDLDQKKKFSNKNEKKQSIECDAI